jgi:hypothetical protein
MNEVKSEHMQLALVCSRQETRVSRRKSLRVNIWLLFWWLAVGRLSVVEVVIDY